MQKFLTNFLANCIQQYKKTHTPWLSRIHPKFLRLVQHMQINQCDSPHKQKGRQRPHDHLNRCRKSFVHIVGGGVPGISRGLQGTEGPFLVWLFHGCSPSLMLQEEHLHFGFPWKQDHNIRPSHFCLWSSLCLECPPQPFSFSTWWLMSSPLDPG